MSGAAVEQVVMGTFLLIYFVRIFVIMPCLMILVLRWAKRQQDKQLLLTVAVLGALAAVAFQVALLLPKVENDNSGLWKPLLLWTPAALLRYSEMIPLGVIGMVVLTASVSHFLRGRRSHVR